MFPAKVDRKSFYAVLIASSIAIFNLSSAQADSRIQPGDPYQYISNQESGQHNIYFHDGVGSHGNGGFGNHSFMLNIDLNQAAQGRPLTDPTCTSLNAQSCATAENIQWNSELPQCVEKSDTNCISGFGMVADDNSRITGKFLSYFPSKAQNAFTGDLNRKIPTGASANVYSVSNPDGSSTSYLVSSFLSGVFHRSNDSNQLAGFNLSVTPVKITPALNPGPCITNETYIGLRGGPCADDGYVKIPAAESAGGAFYGEAGGVGADCGDGLNRIFAKANFDKLCATQIRFPSSQKYYVTLRLNNPPSGWMHGRLGEPSISITKSTTGSDYEFIGKPVIVPLLYKSNYWKDLPDTITSQYGIDTGQFKGTNCDGSVGKLMSASDFKNPLLRNFTAMPCPSGILSIKELNLWLPLFNNSATAAPAYWNVRTISKEETQGSDKCFNDPNQITGIVTTNATNYTSGPPIFDKGTGELNYQVASPHYLPDGTTAFKGSYNLIMRSDVARCIYSFSSAPVSATISVISENGQQQIATTVVGESAGWLSLSATNFEFSSPKLKVKLSQETPVVTTNNVKPSSVSPKKITCIKGKVSKVITGIKPSCPAGYKLKS